MTSSGNQGAEESNAIEPRIPVVGHASRARPELLAPAGDMECLRAAVENGADAVYFGLDHGFNARARAANFARDQLAETMRFLHWRGVKGYVTLNTLVFPSELHDAEQTIRLVALAGVDGVLVQDLGIAQLAREVCPDLPIHASTQMSLTSAEGMRVASELGAERVVVARELSVDEIRAIRPDTDMVLEVFVHGALCVAYSGQCLTSESLGGRSANRGQCAQACRLPYDLVCDGKLVDLGEVKYLLSPQDLAAHPLIVALIEAGAGAFKIEGRLKSPEYVANITRHYRQAIDSAMAGRPIEFSRHEIEEMELSFSRGFSTGWLKGSDHKMLVPGRGSAKRGVPLGEITRVGDRRVELRLRCSLKPGDGIVFEGDRAKNQEQGGRVFAVYQGNRRLEGPVSEGLVEIVMAREAVDPSRLWQGQLAWKTDDPELVQRWRRTFLGQDPLCRIPLQVSVRAVVGERLTVDVRAAHGVECHVVSDEPLAAARNRMADRDLLRTQLGRLGGTPYELAEINVELTGGPMIPLSVLGRLRHEMVRLLDEGGTAPRPLACSPPGAVDRLRERWRRRCEAAGPSVGNVAGNTVGNVAGNVVGNSADNAVSNLVGDSVGHSAGLSRDTAIGCSMSPVEGSPCLRVLCRTLDQLETVLALGIRMVYADFQDIREYRRAVEVARQGKAEIFLATPRIQKPGEIGIFRLLARYRADGILVRNLGGLSYFRSVGVPMVADYSLNTANDLTLRFLRDRGAMRVAPSYDLNREQILDLVSAATPEWLEIVIHQHMPLFHMEHCVFCAVLSPGTNKTNCGRPCDIHDVQLRDRIGMAHPLRADVGCRNTLFNAVPQSGAEIVPILLEKGVRDFRLELLNEPTVEIEATVHLYSQLLAGEIKGKEVWRRLNAANRVGVTRGTLEERRNPLAIL